MLHTLMRVRFNQYVSHAHMGVACIFVQVFVLVGVMMNVTCSNKGAGVL